MWELDKRVLASACPIYVFILLHCNVTRTIYYTKINTSIWDHFDIERMFQIFSRIVLGVLAEVRAPHLAD